jgi:hydroxymethylglutaryl-CoA lyase
MRQNVNICEVVLRDGIQKEPQFIATQDKLRIFDTLATAGLRKIEVTSFVNAKIIPQLADADVVAAHAQANKNIDSRVLVINNKGFQKALDAGAQAISLVATCSETFSKKNNNMSVAESEKAICEILALAKEKKVATRVYMTTAWVCPYEGKVNPDTVLKRLEPLLAYQPQEIVLADTIGYATPTVVKSLLKQTSSLVKSDSIYLHLHDTKAFGLANILAALECDIYNFDSALGGVGGCPFAPGAAGNLATEDLVFFLEEMGLTTNIDLDVLWRGVELLEKILNRPLGGRSKAFHFSRNVTC